MVKGLFKNCSSSQYFLMALIGIFGLLRLVGAPGELWLDELWSMQSASQLTNPLAAFSLFDDNNHLINTLWIYFLGPDWHPLMYRLPALIAGVATLILISLLWQKRPELEQQIVLWLVGLSYPFVLYSSEARGYSLMLTGLLLCWYSLEQLNEKSTRLRVGTYWLATALALLAHPSSLPALAALILWDYLSRWKINGFIKLTALHTPAVTLCLVYWWWFVRHLPTGSGPLRSLPEVLTEALSVTVGGPVLSSCQPQVGLLGLIVGFFVFTLVAREMGFCYTSRPRWGLLVFLLLVVAPASSLIIYRPRVLFPRYFLPSLLILLTLLGSFIARQLEGSKLRQVVATVLLMLFTAGSLYHCQQLIVRQRGNFKTIISQITNLDNNVEITIGGQHPWRDLIYLQFLNQDDVSFKYQAIDTDTLAKDLPRWLIINSSDSSCRPQDHLKIPQGYQPVAFSPTAPLSGLGWELYQR